MKGHGAKLPRKQEAAIAALLSHRNTEEAANSIGVSPNTLRRWKEIPDFQEAVLQARDAQQHIFRLQRLGSELQDVPGGLYARGCFGGRVRQQLHQQRPGSAGVLLEASIGMTDGIAARLQIRLLEIRNLLPAPERVGTHANRVGGFFGVAVA